MNIDCSGFIVRHNQIVVNAVEHIVSVRRLVQLRGNDLGHVPFYRASGDCVFGGINKVDRFGSAGDCFVTAFTA